MKISWFALSILFSLPALSQELSLDESFGNEGKVVISLQEQYDYDAITSVFIQPDGKIMCCAETEIEGNTAVLMRFNADGSPDNAFGTNGILNTGTSVEHANHNFMLLDDGKMLLFGMKLSDDFSSADFELSKYNPDGSLDIAFGNNGVALTNAMGNYGFGMAIGTTTAGNVIAAGALYDTWESHAGQYMVMKYLNDGNPDPSFGDNGKVTGTVFNNSNFSESPVAIAVQPDGKILVAGNGINYDIVPEVSVPYLLRLNQDGSMDMDFGDNGKILGTPSAFNGVNSLVLTGDGKIILSGYTFSAGLAKVLAMKYNNDGSPDISFGTSGTFTKDVFNDGNDDIFYKNQLLPDGKILFTGVSYHDEKANLLLLQLNADGALDTTFGDGGIFLPVIANTNTYMSTIAMQPDGKLVLGGSIDIGSEYYDTILLRLNTEDLSISDLGSNALSVYPNPASDFINMDFTLPQDDKVTFGLFDISGKKVVTLVSNTDFPAGLNSIKLNLPATLSKGIYFLRISNGNESSVIKLVK
ncbi:T9SS type A sorting domain-containing protein [Flavobacterium pallidum]|uniref:Secretion system C-terminal sorting domain-containing protein n=1 Tax=Flavobacterium pallidum TaxID=2172098 RepID=A0A2S1SHQ5_9FLAO|nr:T9SS type A sorting domain-containing protein [Flavobacterium pallidum]AWI25915.1 hypothetical protein HYN49_08385 [Flavobacterium pallidum]